MFKILLSFVILVVARVSMADETFLQSISVYGGLGPTKYEYIYNNTDTPPVNTIATMDTTDHFTIGTAFYARPGVYGIGEEGLSNWRYNMFLGYQYTSDNLTNSQGVSAKGTINGLDIGWALHYLVKIPNESFKMFLGPMLIANVSTINMSGSDQEKIFGRTLSYGDRTNFTAILGAELGFIIKLNQTLDMEIGYRYENGVWSWTQTGNPNTTNSYEVSNQVYLAFTFF